MQVNGPSGRKDSDNKVLLIASCTLMVFKCVQKVNAVLGGEMKFRGLSKHVLFFFWCLENCRLDANAVLIFDHLYISEVLILNNQNAHEALLCLYYN